jgi:hypothetical protein
MTDKELAQVLIEELADDGIDKKISAYANRLMLRLHSQPALMANLADVTVFKPGAEEDTPDQVEDGEFQEAPDRQNAVDRHSPVLIQLSFRRLPQEVISPLIRLMGAPREPKVYRFVKDGQARMGVELELRPQDFPGDDYEYAF